MLRAAASIGKQTAYSSRQGVIKYSGSEGLQSPTGHQHSFRWLTIPEASTHPLVVTGAKDFNQDSGCCRAMNPDMVLGSSPGLDNTMAPGDSAGHSDQYGPGSGKVLRHPHGHRLWPRPQAAVWSLLAIWIMSSNTHPKEKGWYIYIGHENAVLSLFKWLCFKWLAALPAQLVEYGALNPMELHRGC